MSIDPRLTERRRVVAEHNAKKSVARLLKFLAALLAVASVVWLAFSPWLSVKEVETTGVSVSDANSILADLGVVAGTPMILIRADQAERALLQDPWVEAASVEVHWPDRVAVTVTERVPLAWVMTDGGWTRRALDGVALPSDPSPDDVMARIEMPELSEESAGTSDMLLGGLEFVSALPLRLRPGTLLTTDQGELWATVGGFRVRLGRPVEMRDKALSLDALLRENLTKGSVLVLVAPTNPAVMTPGAVNTEPSTEQGNG